MSKPYTYPVPTDDGSSVYDLEIADESEVDEEPVNNEPPPRTIPAILDAVEIEQFMAWNDLTAVAKAFEIEVHEDTSAVETETTRERLNEILWRMREINRVLYRVAMEVQ